MKVRGGWKILAILLLAIAIVMRFYRVATYPGINGDEAQMGVEVLRFLNHQPYSFRTNMGQFFNPIFLAIESLLLLRFEPDFLLLRLPAALAGIAAIYLTYRLHRRTFGDKKEAIFAAVLLACMPLVLTFGRCGWDSSFMFFTAPLVLYPAIRISKREATRGDVIILIIGAGLCLSVHITSALFLFGVLFSLLILKGWRWRLLPLIAMAPLLLAVFCLYVRYPVGETFSDMFARSGRLLSHPPELAAYLASIGEILSGARSYRYFAGEIPSPLMVWESRGFLLLAIVMVLAIARREKFLAILCVLIPVLLIAAAGRTMIIRLSFERYVLWLAPIFVILCARLLNWKVIVAGCLLFLVQIEANYFYPLMHLTNQATLEPTFWTANIEPKLQAARIIERANPQGKAIVFAEDWWIEQPLKFLLFEKSIVAPATVKVQPKSGDLIVAFAGSKLDAEAHGELVATIIGANGRPVIRIYSIK